MESAEDRALNSAVTVFRDKYVAGMTPDARALGCPLAEALTKRWPSDAHFAAYAPHAGEGEDSALRLLSATQDADHQSVFDAGIAVRMVAMIGDIDGPDHKATPEWRAETITKIEASGLAYYATKNGFRVLASVDYEIATREDAAAWKEAYLGWCEYLKQAHGLTLDLRCKDFTRLYRLPNVKRDGKAVRAKVIGEIPAFDIAKHSAEPSAQAKPGTAQPAPTASAGIHPKLAERIAAVVAVVAPHYDQDRHQIVRSLGAWLAANDWNDTAIAEVFRQLPSDQVSVRISEALKAAEQKRSGAVTAGWDALRERLGDADAARLEACAVPRFGDALERMRARREAGGAVFAPPSSEPTGADRPFFLRSKDGCVTLMWISDDYGHRPIAEKVIRTEILRRGYSVLIPLTEGARDIPIHKILEVHGQNYARTEYAFRNRVTEYDPTGEGRVTIGYPLAGVTARFDAAVDEWLRALAGGHYDRLAVWIASCAQKHINRLSAYLIVVGHADSGKSMLAHAIARMWRETPPPLSLINEKFNADMQRCPILADEEAQLVGSGKLSTQVFRDAIQQPSRSIELKGKERAQLHGGLRAIVSCNGVSDLKFSNLGGAAVIKALEDRILLLDALDRGEQCAAALAKFRLVDDWRVDLDRAAGHMAWLCETVVLPSERFLGSGGETAEGAILMAHLAADPEIWESLRVWLDTGSGGPWYIHKGALVVADVVLATSLESTGKGYSLERVRKALDPLATGPRERPEIAGARHRVIPLDYERLARVLPDVAESLRALVAQGARRGMGPLTR